MDIRATLMDLALHFGGGTIFVARSGHLPPSCEHVYMNLGQFGPLPRRRSLVIIAECQSSPMPGWRWSPPGAPARNSTTATEDCRAPALRRTRPTQIVEAREIEELPEEW